MEYDNIINGEILSEDDLSNFRAINSDKKIVLCVGCFDILHPGHIAFFNECRKLGDILVVLGFHQSLE